VVSGRANRSLALSKTTPPAMLRDELNSLALEKLMGICKECHGQPLRYGMAPHHHDIKRTGSIIGSTVLVPKESWPKNFSPDPEEEGAGIYTCEHCNGTGKEPLEPYDEDECPHQYRFEHRGYLRCRNCGAVYNESTCEWEKAPNE